MHPQTKKEGEKANLNNRNRKTQLTIEDQKNNYHPLTHKGIKWHERKIIKETLSMENKIIYHFDVITDKIWDSMCLYIYHSILCVI